MTQKWLIFRGPSTRKGKQSANTGKTSDFTNREKQTKTSLRYYFHA